MKNLIPESLCSIGAASLIAGLAALFYARGLPAYALVRMFNGLITFPPATIFGWAVILSFVGGGLAVFGMLMMKRRATSL